MHDSGDGETAGGEGAPALNGQANQDEEERYVDDGGASPANGQQREGDAAEEEQEAQEEGEVDMEAYRCFLRRSSPQQGFGVSWSFVQYYIEGAPQL